MQSKNRRRTKYFVDKKVQGGLGIRILMHWVLFLALSLVMTTLLRLLVTVDEVSPAQAIRVAMFDQLVPITALLALLPWFVYDALKLSNRFAGPMVRLRYAMRELCSGGPTRKVVFRDGDFWLDIADEFNHLQEQILDERRELEALRQRPAASLETTAPSAPVVVPTLPSPPLSTPTPLR